MKRFALIAVALAGCTTPQAAPVAGQVGVMPDDGCGRGRIADLIGKPITTAVEADARQRSGAKAMRVLRPGTAATMDYRPDRINIDVDERNIVTAIRCG